MAGFLQRVISSSSKVRHGSEALLVVEISWAGFGRLAFVFRLYPGPGILYLLVSIEGRWVLFKLRFGLTQPQKLVLFGNDDSYLILSIYE